MRLYSLLKNSFFFMPSCKECHLSYDQFPDEATFLKKMDFQFGNSIISLPERNTCADCSNQLRTAHRNERFLYHRASDKSGKQMISLYQAHAPWGKPYTIYTQEEWHGDSWDPMDYGREFDFNRPFFDQFAELQKDVPRVTLISLGNENSPYTTGTGYCKNCHLINSSEYCEDCYYGKLLQSCKDSVDCTYLYDSQLCYECFSVYKSYNCAFVSFSSNCSDCFFSENLTACRNCFLCTNLNNKEYHFMNKPLAKEEYQKRIAEFMGSHQNFEQAKKLLQKLKLERIHKYTNIVSSENSTGDFIQNSRNCLNCYDVNDGEDCRNVWVGVKTKDVYDCSNMYVKPQLNYQVLGTIETYHVAYSIYAFHSSDVLYSDQIYHSKNLFGCAGLKKKEYCIFNKQYSKEEYDAIVPKIIEHMKKTGEWGQFFPVKYSPHGYNESLANEYYPLPKEEVAKRGWNWAEDKEAINYQGPDYPVPDHIRDVKDEIIEKILRCEVSGKPYKIMPHELTFYRRMKFPIPRKCPDQRYDDRLKLRNQRKLYERVCAKCGSAVISTYDPKRPEKIYCEKCYAQEVF